MTKFTIFLAAGCLMALPASAASYRMMFDVLSPTGIECHAEAAPGGGAKVSRSPLGKPVIRLSGDVRQARIFCDLADGSQWEATAHKELPVGTMQSEGTVALRQDAASAFTVVDADSRTSIVARSFVPSGRD